MTPMPGPPPTSRLDPSPARTGLARARGCWPWVPHRPRHHHSSAPNASQASTPHPTAGIRRCNRLRSSTHRTYPSQPLTHPLAPADRAAPDPGPLGAGPYWTCGGQTGWTRPGNRPRPGLGRPRDACGNRCRHRTGRPGPAGPAPSPAPDAAFHAHGSALAGGPGLGETGDSVRRTDRVAPPRPPDTSCCRVGPTSGSAALGAPGPAARRPVRCGNAAAAGRLGKLVPCRIPSISKAAAHAFRVRCAGPPARCGAVFAVHPELLSAPRPPASPACVAARRCRPGGCWTTEPSSSSPSMPANAPCGGSSPNLRSGRAVPALGERR